ncbi:hypothetical protein GOP47_0007314 [Adiantum capillus-veneris]|uniref:C2H2-type domain-containing protein n=1 Tax=Adiantum capillus-veneris TaxID=13818 RepID=A0A9D4V0G3_ADICA|nr:hypothetical protein GOP47_0007314 [Adiantum capillus-veneris]
MEFWGVEVPSGKPLTCQPGPSSYVHVSQAALGDGKNAKGNDRVVLKVKVGSNQVIVGTLSQGKCDQTTLDLIFEKDFVLSHNSSGSVYFCGYKTDAVRDDDSMSSGSEDEFDMSDDDEDDDEEEATLPAKENGRLGVTKSDKKAAAPANKPAAKSPAPKVEMPATEGKSKVKPTAVEKGKGAKEKSKEDDEEDDSDEDAEEDDSDEDDEEMMALGSDDDDLDSDEEDESDEEASEEEQPKLAKKKRPAPTPPAANTGKKAKVDTPGKAEPKTPSVPASTPKQQQSGKKDQSAKKTPGKENTTTPASGKKLGQFFCQPCSKNFNSESALTQHKAAKHKS